MTIAVGGNIGAMLELRDALLETQTIMTRDLKFPIAVSVWDQDRPLRDGLTGLTGNLVKIKANYPVNNVGNAFINDPKYAITDLNGNVILSGGAPKYSVDILRGEIWIGTVPVPYPVDNPSDPNFNAAAFTNRVGLVRFRVRESGILAEHKAQFQNLSTVINTLTSLIGMFQKQESALLNSGAIS